MKNNVLLITCLALVGIVHAQSFQEVCSSSNTNGVVVNSEFYNDTLYSTGFFNLICGESVNYIARWEDNEWKPSGINISDPGHALRVIGDKLYIAKYEESIDSNWVYVYENGSLDKLGEGVYLTTASGFSELPNIYDIIEYDGKIIACGEFDRVGAQSISGIMQWNGNTWESMGAGLDGNITGTAPVMFPHQMLVYNSELYVVGNFKNAGGLEVNGIAKWDGTGWSNMGSGFNNTVYSLIEFEGELIAGGSFTESGGTTINRIAKWDGMAWIPIDFGFTPVSANDFIFVHTMKEIDDVLYIGGGLKEITYSDNSTEVCNGLVSYSNNTLNTFMGGVPGNDIEAISKLDNGQLLIGGGVFGSGYIGITPLNTNTVDRNFESNITIAPNPFTDEIFIDSDIDFDRYEVFNEVGKKVFSGKYNNSIQLNLTTGLYILKLIDKEASASIHKIVKR